MDNSTFSFISPKQLRENIVDSVNFVAYLWILAETIEAEYVDEMIRTIILYNISIIEALLLFRAKKEKLQFSKLVYKKPTVLPKDFQHISETLVVAYQMKEKKEASEIWLHDLIREQKDFLGASLHHEIKTLQGIRNTFHLSAARNALAHSSAENSFDTVLKLVEKLRNAAS